MRRPARRAAWRLGALLLVGSLWWFPRAAELQTTPASGVLLQQDGVPVGRITTINCTSPNMTCTLNGSTGDLVSSGGGGGAPTTATYLTQVPDAGLSAEQALSLLGTGLLRSTTGTGVVAIYAGTTCGGGDFLKTLDAAGAGTCGTPAGGGTVTHTAGPLTANALVLGNAADDLTVLGTLGTTTTVLHGNAGGPPTFAQVVSGDLNITTTSCTNQFVTALSSGAVGTCTTAVLASAQFANQGTTTTVLHGNAAGNPSFAAVSLTGDISGILPVANGGTGLASGTSGGILAYTATGTLASSGALTADLPVIGGGAGVVPTVGTRSGNTTAFVTTSGTQTSGDCVKIDANGNHIANGSACGGSGVAVDVQVFNAGAAGVCPGTAATCWTKASGVTMVTVFGCGAGGGGGGGSGAAAGSVRAGGGGGGGGYCSQMIFRASDLPATVAVTTGVGGTFGAGGSSASGSDAGAGNSSAFGAFATWLGGGGGAGNNAGASGGTGGGCTGAGVSVTAATGGAGGACVTAGAAAGATNVGLTGHGAPSTNAAAGGIAGNYSALGGGSGAGSTTAGAVTTLAGGGAWLSGAGGGAGGGVNLATPGTAQAGTAGGSVAWGLTTAGGGGAGGTVAACGSGGNGVAGSAGDFGIGGFGGGGGASVNSATGCTGAAGGQGGGGGGGGGGGTSTGGAGGVGGVGLVIVVSF